MVLLGQLSVELVGEYPAVPAVYPARLVVVVVQAPVRFVVEFEPEIVRVDTEILKYFVFKLNKKFLIKRVNTGLPMDFCKISPGFLVFFQVFLKNKFFGLFQV